MSLHSGIDTCAFVSLGLYTKNYGVGEQANVNSLFVSLGLLEEAPEGTQGGWHRFINMVGWPWLKVWKAWG